MLQATAEDLTDVFKTVDTAARKSRYVKPQKVLAVRVIQFPRQAAEPDFPELRLRGFCCFGDLDMGVQRLLESVAEKGPKCYNSYTY